MSLNFQEIYNLQRELNVMIGRDTVDDAYKSKWFLDYCIALHDEATEMFNCCNWKWWSVEGKQEQYQKIVDFKNAKIEAIDCLHFIISLMQIVDINFDKDKEEFLEQLWDDQIKLNNKKEYLGVFSLYIINFSVELQKLCFNILPISELLFKEYLIPDHNTCQLRYCMEFEEAKEILNETLSILISIFIILDFDKEDILKIYKMKHQKNIERQKNKYSVVTKTETDNNEIKSQI